MLEKLLKKILTKEFAKFAASGISAWLVEIFIVLILTEYAGLWYALSAGVSIALGSSLSFALQKYWTFAHYCRKKIWYEAGLYVFVMGASVYANIIFIHLTVESFRRLYDFHYDYVVAQAIIGPILGIMNFLIYKYLIFVKYQEKAVVGSLEKPCSED